MRESWCPSAILGLPLADAAAVPGVREFMDTCCREAAAATVASGSRLRPVFGLTEDQVTDADIYAPALLEIVLQKFSSPTTRTTVLQDWMKGRRAEVQEINGTVVRAMRAAGPGGPCERANGGDRAPYRGGRAREHRRERGSAARVRSGAA